MCFHEISVTKNEFLGVFTKSLSGKMNFYEIFAMKTVFLWNHCYEKWITNSNILCRIFTKPLSKKTTFYEIFVTKNESQLHFFRAFFTSFSCNYNFFVTRNPCVKQKFCTKYGDFYTYFVIYKDFVHQRLINM